MTAFILAAALAAKNTYDALQSNPQQLNSNCSYWPVKTAASSSSLGSSFSGRQFEE